MEGSEVADVAEGGEEGEGEVVEEVGFLSITNKKNNILQQLPFSSILELFIFTGHKCHDS